MQTGQFSLDEGFLPPANAGAQRFTTAGQLIYVGYAKPAFNGYAEYFGTTTGPESVNGTGLANYSNRGFYSFGTNINDTSFPSPPPDGTGLGTVIVSGNGLPDPTGNGLVDMTRNPMLGSVIFRTGTVQDTVTNLPEPNVKLSARGLWDQFLEEKTLFAHNTLNYYNYDDQAKLLVPRAVAYSAGLIDYFFRGKLTVSLPDEGVYGIVDHYVEKSITSSPPQGFRKIRLKVKNSTDAISGTEQHMTGGKLVAVVKFHRNTCYTEDLSGEWGAPDASGGSKGPIVFDTPEQGGCRTKDEEIVVSDIKTTVSLPAGGADQPFEFSFGTPIPINATDVYLQVVYRGKLGSEDDAVAVETRDITEPNFTKYLNTNDYLFCYNGIWHHRGPAGEFPPELLGSVPNGETLFPVWPLTDLRIAYEPYDLTPTSNTLVQVAVIPPKSYIRYATLGELNRNWGATILIKNGATTISHNLHAIDPRLLANQVYSSYDAETNTISLDPRAKRVTKIRQTYAGYGVFYYEMFPDLAGCPEDSFPADVYDPPTLVPVTINGAFGQP